MNANEKYPGESSQKLRHTSASWVIKQVSNRADEFIKVRLTKLKYEINKVSEPDALCLGV